MGYKRSKVLSWVVELVCYINELTRSIFLMTVRIDGPQKTKKAKIGPKGDPNHKIAYYEAKWDLKVPKIHSWLLEHRSAIEAYKGQNGARNRPKRGYKTQNRKSQCPANLFQEHPNQYQKPPSQSQGHPVQY